MTTGTFLESPRPASPRPRSRLATLADRVWYEFWKNFVWLMLRLLVRFRYEGREHEPRSGPFIVAANHASFLDPPLVAIGLHHKSAHMAKDSLFTVPILGPWLRSMGSFPVRRGTPDRRAIRHSLDVIEQGGVLLIFPEGTRSTDGRLREPEAGAAMIALRTGVPVVPAAVINSHRIMRKGRRLPNPFGRIIVRYGRPMAVPKIEGRLDHATMQEWGNRIMAAIEALLPEDQHRER